MQIPLKSVVTGAISGIATYFISILALGYTAAFTMPKGFPLALWDALVVFGLGALLVAFAIHFTALRVFRPRRFPSFAAILIAVIAALGITGLLSNGGHALASWALGALLASLVVGWRRSDSSGLSAPVTL